MTLEGCSKKHVVDLPSQQQFSVTELFQQPAAEEHICLDLPLLQSHARTYKACTESQTLLWCTASVQYPTKVTVSWTFENSHSVTSDARQETLSTGRLFFGSYDARQVILSSGWTIPGISARSSRSLYLRLTYHVRKAERTPVIVCSKDQRHLVLLTLQKWPVRKIWLCELPTEHLVSHSS